MRLNKGTPRVPPRSVPTPLFRRVWPDTGGFNARLKEIVPARKEADPSTSRSNVGGWQSGHDLITWPHPEMRQLGEMIHEAFGAVMEKNKKGVIVNISSMAAQGIITRVCGYSASKAAIDNFTKWLAVEKSTKLGDKIRVNAIAPGFFLAEQNRALLTNPDGSLTARGP